MPAVHKKDLGAITACRTGELGLVLYQCACCGQTQAMGRACGDRHCPSFQPDKAEAGLENEIDRLLPNPYFLVRARRPCGPVRRDGRRRRAARRDCRREPAADCQDPFLGRQGSLPRPSGGLSGPSAVQVIRAVLGHPRAILADLLLDRLAAHPDAIPALVVMAPALPGGSIRPAGAAARRIVEARAGTAASPEATSAADRPLLGLHDRPVAKVLVWSNLLCAGVNSSQTPSLGSTPPG
jgi:hypothetical protein